jgi:putative heme iron utilization protein
MKPITRPEPGAERGLAARRLMRRQAHAALATSLAEAPGGHPYVSLVAAAFDLDASPLLLLSDLAQHSRNIAADPRVSLLFDGGERNHLRAVSDPLAEPRLSLIGAAARCDEPGLLTRFTARHPNAAAYAEFADFHLYRVTIGRGHLVAGFGRINWVEASDLRFAGNAGALAVAEAEIVGHMNADHADAVGLFAARLLKRRGAGWQMTGIDPDGIDLRRPAGKGGETARLDFAAPVLDPDGARQALIALTQAARAAPGSENRRRAGPEVASC